MSRFRPILIGLLGLISLPQIAAASELVQATAIDGGLAAWWSGDRLNVGSPDRTTASIELPRGVSVTSVRSTNDGWIAAGNVLDERDRPDLLLIEKSPSGIEILTPPPRTSAKQRGQAIPLIEAGELVGVAWVAGSRQSDLQVFAATRDSDQWSGRETVSGSGPGSQLALTGDVLGDGSWLLVWTRFDGGDDETVFSRRVDGVWTQPARIHEDNQVPDITPCVIAVEGGALAAWSWFDGSDYRLRTARFDGSNWSTGRPVGAKGSLFPSLITGTTGAQLLFQTVEPETWTVVQTDLRGKLVRQASVSKTDTERPIIVERDGAEVRLVWPSESSAKDSRSAESLIWEPLQ